MSDERMEWDDDISKLERLSDIEKNGLQVYRNYTRSFTLRRVEELVDKLNETAPDLSRLKNCIHLIEKDELRFLPIIACAFADDVLKDMYSREIPSNVPGGKRSLIGEFGPLSTLANRLKLAHCFGWIDELIARDLDLVRRMRNDVAHSFAHKPHHITDRIVEMTAIEEEFIAKGWMKKVPDDLEAKFRVRLIYLLGLLFTSSIIFPISRNSGLAPHTILFGDVRPKFFDDVNELCWKSSVVILAVAEAVRMKKAGELDHLQGSSQADKS